MSSLVGDTVALVGFATVLVGGVYLLLPRWGDLPTGDEAEDVAARILLSPVNVAGNWDLFWVQTSCIVLDMNSALQTCNAFGH
jgi:hypothetical protein